MSGNKTEFQVNGLPGQKTNYTFPVPEKIFSDKKGKMRQMMLSLVVSVVFIVVSMPLGYSAIFLPQIRDPSEPINMDLNMESWFASIYALAQPFGSYIAGITMERYGRQPTLMYPMILTIIGWALIATATSHSALLSGRFLIGMSNSLVAAVYQIYVSECADPELRGIFINLGYISFSIGVLSMSILGALLHWRWVAWCSIAIPALTMFGLYFMPETPTWLIYHDKKDQANKVLLWLRGDAALAKREFDDLCKRCEAEGSGNDQHKSSFLEDLRKSCYLKPTILVFLLMFSLQCSGTYMVVFYSVDILSNLSSTVDGLTTSVVTSIVRLIATVTFCCVFHYVGRRKIYITSGLGSGISLAALAIYMVFFIGAESSIIDFYVACTLITVYIAVNTGYLLARNIIVGEMLPAKIRGRVVSYMFVILNITFFIWVKAFPYLQYYLGVEGIFIIFAGANFAAATLTYFFIPETKGKSLGEIEDYFKQDGLLYKRYETETNDRKKIAV